MNNLAQRGRRLFANTMHRQLFLLVFMAALVPTVLSSVALYFLFFNTAAEQMGMPEAIAYNLLPAAWRVISILLLFLPAGVGVILFFAYQVSHRIVGPYDRILRELDESLMGKKTGPIILRKHDRFLPLVEKINVLLERIQK